MELLFAILGCLASFGLGAYVRGRREGPPAPPPPEEDRLTRQWLDLLRYDGKRKGD